VTAMKRTIAQRRRLIRYWSTGASLARGLVVALAVPCAGV
jgi:hypothetical protein